MKLTLDQQDLIKELLQSELWQAVLILCELGLERQSNAVLSYDLSQGAEGLAFQLARLEGAKSLVAAVESAKDLFKEKRKHSPR